MTPEELKRVEEWAEAQRLKDELETWDKFHLFKPYEPQVNFFCLTATKRETTFLAGNKTGKSESGAYMTTCHLTGIYPKDWPGKRFVRPPRMWVGSPTSNSTRDVCQDKLCGPHGVVSLFGSGMIPKHLIIDKTLSHGVSDAFDTLQVRHASGGVSLLGFKTYAQGRDVWQGDVLDAVWLDEEPPSDIYGEALTRLNGPGILYTTCTPLEGVTEFIAMFYPEPTTAYRGIAMMGLEDAKHFTPEEIEQRVAGMEPHLREARMSGRPVVATGQVFTATEEMIKMQTPPGFWRAM